MSPLEFMQRLAALVPLGLSLYERPDREHIKRIRPLHRPTIRSKPAIFTQRLVA